MSNTLSRSLAMHVHMQLCVQLLFNESERPSQAADVEECKPMNHFQATTIQRHVEPNLNVCIFLAEIVGLQSEA